MARVKPTSGFIYIWRDRKYNRYYVGSHWGTEDDGYICSSNWMKVSYSRRPADFKRRVIARGIDNRPDLLKEEARWLSMIKPAEVKSKYYNLRLDTQHLWHADPLKNKTIGQKISAAKTGKPITFKDPAERARKISESKKAAFVIKPYPKKEKPPKIPKPKRIKPVVLCKVCSEPTPNPRSNFCSKEHRYQAMNATRASLVGTKWCQV